MGLKLKKSGIYTWSFALNRPADIGNLSWEWNGWTSSTCITRLLLVGTHGPHAPVTSPKKETQQLVGGLNPSETYESQLWLLFPIIIWKNIKHVPNISKPPTGEFPFSVSLNFWKTKGALRRTKLTHFHVRQGFGINPQFVQGKLRCFRPTARCSKPFSQGATTHQVESEADNFGYCGANCTTQHDPTVVDVLALPFKKAGESEVNIKLIKKSLR